MWYKRCTLARTTSDGGYLLLLQLLRSCDTNVANLHVPPVTVGNYYCFNCFGHVIQTPQICTYHQWRWVPTIDSTASVMWYKRRKFARTTSDGGYLLLLQLLRSCDTNAANLHVPPVTVGTYYCFNCFGHVIQTSQICTYYQWRCKSNAGPLA